MPNASAHIPEGSVLWEEIKRRADERHDGKISAYVRAAIERDIETGSRDNLAATVLVDLTRDLLGKLDAQIVADHLQGQDQRFVLRQILSQYIAQLPAQLAVAEGSKKTRKQPNPGN